MDGLPPAPVAGIPRGQRDVGSGELRVHGLGQCLDVHGATVANSASRISTSAQRNLPIV
jgi:hypothetical protein